MQVAVHYPTSQTYSMQWDYALCNFWPSKLFVIGNESEAPPYGEMTLNKATWVPDATHLDGQLVVLCPKDGRYVQGVESLDTFKHTDDMVYLFGDDSGPMSDDTLGGRVPDRTVFVPNDTSDDMFSWVSYAVVAWDWRMKSLG